MPNTNTQKNCTNEEKEQGTYNIIACGFAYNAPIADQHNLISNELIRYTTFTKYYAHHLRHDIKTQPQIQNNSSLQKLTQQGEKNAAYMMKEREKAVKATSKSIQHVGQIHSTFPLHIHLLAYHEVISSTRNILAKTYTPLNQLYYKLINVQQQGN